MVNSADFCSQQIFAVSVHERSVEHGVNVFRGVNRFDVVERMALFYRRNEQLARESS